MMIRNTCVSGSMLSGIEIWPLFVHSTHRLPEIFSSDFIKVSLHIDMYMSRNIKVKIKIKLTNIFPENKNVKLTHNSTTTDDMIMQWVEKNGTENRKRWTEGGEEEEGNFKVVTDRQTSRLKWKVYFHILLTLTLQPLSTMTFDI